ncbi:SAUR-like auxin-responsive protein family [Rhynchospora pubera]|uniref:SAUR-like auxin-responsive protein family n=1 Tax=Rhynchospora pubera TaxID=906938 RepID=A0AAV8GJA7_9POAL|nr:SAUR-like auxin-responsive protein family [Rhynchospora pubera]KAJ4776928.1 SAUR-like auxin-responsive protein family [Rhynchospora pubera]KAJ4803961.1 SAUR-like auxin-responsive protein family [Rhynchospora pubera]
MMNTKGFAQMSKKWQRLIDRRVSRGTTDQCTTQIAQKGHFVVYTLDATRFEIPLEYLNSGIIGLLFKSSEEELGYTAGGPITLACDAMVMEYVMDLVRRGVPKEVERAVVNLLFFSSHQSCSLPSKIGALSQQLEAC